MSHSKIHCLVRVTLSPPPLKDSLLTLNLLTFLPLKDSLLTLSLLLLTRILLKGDSLMLNRWLPLLPLMDRRLMPLGPDVAPGWCCAIATMP